MSTSASRVLVIGAAGRLGRVVCDEFEGAGYLVIPTTRTDLEVTDAQAIARTVDAAAPHVIVNCTAFNAVDGAESDPTTAFAVNAQAPGALADAAAGAGAVFVHYSTDFVFDGRSTRPYSEEDAVNPLSVYGASKLAGEVNVRNQSTQHFILRVESLYGGVGVGGHRATIDQIAAALLNGAPVRALVDRTVSPSYVPDIARATRELIQRAAPAGTYHCVSTGMTTWYDMAQYMAVQLGVRGRIERVLTSELKMKAPRPQFCALSNEKLRSVGIEVPHWRAVLAQHLTQGASTTASVGSR